jgi:predicted amidophosphoribosyltransferase
MHDFDPDHCRLCAEHLTDPMKQKMRELMKRPLPKRLVHFGDYEEMN